MKRLWLVLAGAMALTACGKSVKGTYNMVNAPVPGVVAMFGDKTSPRSARLRTCGRTAHLFANSMTWVRRHAVQGCAVSPIWLMPIGSPRPAGAAAARSLGARSTGCNGRSRCT
jgi:hypothetical protein